MRRAAARRWAFGTRASASTRLSAHRSRRPWQTQRRTMMESRCNQQTAATLQPGLYSAIGLDPTERYRRSACRPHRGGVWSLRPRSRAGRRWGAPLTEPAHHPGPSVVPSRTLLQSWCVGRDVPSYGNSYDGSGRRYQPGGARGGAACRPGNDARRPRPRCRLPPTPTAATDVRRHGCPSPSGFWSTGIR